MRITQKDIARKLGISLITVNRAFNNSGYVSPELKKRIFDYAKKQSYIPLRASQILVRNKTQVISVFTPAFPDYFWEDIKKGVLSAGKYIKSLNYDVRFIKVPDYDTNYFIKALKRELRNGLCAAAFVNKPFFDMDRILGIVESAGIPYLFFNVDAPFTNRICYIGTEYAAGGKLAANFIGKSLAVQGKGRVLVITVNDIGEQITSGPDINMKRIQGFVEVMEQQYPHIVCQVVYLDAESRAGADGLIMDLLKKNEGRVNAVYFVPAYNASFLKGLATYEYRRTITLLHDVNDMVLKYLEQNLLTAVIFQDPILQGNITVRSLEHLLESKTARSAASRVWGKQRDIEIVYTLIFKENSNYLRNHSLLAEFDA
jgi:LacI family transcriptional regulator